MCFPSLLVAAPVPNSRVPSHKTWQKGRERDVNLGALKSKYLFASYQIRVTLWPVGSEPHRQAMFSPTSRSGLSVSAVRSASALLCAALASEAFHTSGGVPCSAL